MEVRAFLAGFVVAGVLLFAISAAKADSEWSVAPPSATPSPTAPADESSNNFSKTGRFLPGEEVVTSTGKKMKVWSTEGPVPVMQPTPMPGYGAGGELPHGVNVIVDERSPVRPRSRRESTEDRAR